MNKKKQTVSVLVSRDGKPIPVSRLDSLIEKFAEAYLEIKEVDGDNGKEYSDEKNDR